MANLSNINNKFIVTDGGNGRVLIGATNDIGATLFANHPSTTAPSITFNAPAGQVFENEDLQFAFGLNNASPYNGYMQTRFVSAPYYRNLAINPLGGNVGIGTNSPAYNLVVSSGGASGIEFAIATATGLNEMLSYNRSTSVFEKLRAQALQFEWYTDATANALVIQSGGNVGIGTASPGAKLDILGKTLNLGGDNGSWNARTNSTVKTGFITSPHYTNAEEDIMGMIMIGLSNANEIDIGGGTSSYNAATDIKFFTASNSTTVSGTQRMRIDSSGKTTIPAYADGIKFEITSSLGSNNSIIEMGQVGSDGFLDVSAAGGGIVSHLSGYTGYASYFLSPVGIGTTDGTGGFNVNSTTVGSYYNMSNHDSGNYKYTNQIGRLLTSNGSGWVADGRDPILTLASAGNGGATTVGYSLGLNLYSNTNTNNTYSPLICFSGLSESGSYASAYAAIGGRKIGQGADSNWNTGELHFWTAGPSGAGSASYMQQASAMMINQSGNVGIGIDGPDSRLTVSSSTSNNVANFKSSDGTAYIAISDNSSSSALGNQIGVVGDNMYFATGDVERMRITSAGQLQLQGSSSSLAKSTTQTQWAYIPGNTNASLMSQNPSGMSSASAGYHIVYGANNSSPYQAFIDVITYMCGSSTSVTTVSSTNLNGSPGSRTYSKNSNAVILNISGLGVNYNCNVKTTFINYPH